MTARLAGTGVGDYVGVDLSAAAVEVAERRGLRRSQFVVGDVADLDLGRFDLIVLNEMLYYVEDVDGFLDRLGLLLVSMWRHPGDRSLWRRVDEVFALVDRVEARNRANETNPRGWIVSCHRQRPERPPPP